MENGYVALILGLVQFCFVTVSHADVIHSSINLDLIKKLIRNFFGFYYTFHLLPFNWNLFSGEILFIFLIAVIFKYRKNVGLSFWLLLLGFLSLVLSVTVRVPIHALTPFEPGPRYFFYPYILMSWILLWLAAEATGTLRKLLFGVLMVAHLQALLFLPRREELLVWREHVSACSQSEIYNLPIHRNGNAKEVWSTNLRGVDCRRLIKDSILP